MAVLVTLVDPAGNECLAGSPGEVNDLRNLGYTIKGHGTAGEGAQVQPGDTAQPAATDQTAPDVPPRLSSPSKSSESTQ